MTIWSRRKRISRNFSTIRTELIFIPSWKSSQRKKASSLRPERTRVRSRWSLSPGPPAQTTAASSLPSWSSLLHRPGMSYSELRAKTLSRGPRTPSCPAFTPRRLWWCRSQTWSNIRPEVSSFCLGSARRERNSWQSWEEVSSCQRTTATPTSSLGTTNQQYLQDFSVSNTSKYSLYTTISKLLVWCFQCIIPFFSLWSSFEREFSLLHPICFTTLTSFKWKPWS